jgi:hypothetical protein
MKRLLWFLAVWGLTASAASAGPNFGGVLWVHDTGLVFSNDTELPVVSTPPADCAGVDNQADPGDSTAYTEKIWKVYAAFPAEGSPRLKGTAFGIEFPMRDSSPASFVAMNVDACGLPNENADGTTDMEIPDLGFPGVSGGEVAISFPSARLTTVVTLYYFTGFGYSSGGAFPTWCTMPAHNPANQVFVDDATPANVDLIRGYGCLGFGTPGTTPCPTSYPDAACCALDGSCVITSAADCVAPNVWHLDWVACDPSPCPPPTGACCLGDGTCWLAPCGSPIPGNPCPGGSTASACAARGGTYQGDFVSCDPDPCPPQAPCCLPIGACVIRIQSACEAHDPPGIWHPEWASCYPNPCPQPPIGVCCYLGGSCGVIAEAGCPSPNVWHGEWSSCEPNPCPQPIFACCDLLDGTCAMTTPANCTAPTHEWHMNFTCETYTCPPPAPTGACCYADGTCALVVHVLCTAIWHPEWTSCDPNPCALQVGACCDLVNGWCTVTTEADCPLPGAWFPEWPGCDPNPCPQSPPIGACCDMTTGDCVMTTQADCPFTWLGPGVPCAIGACSPPPTPIERTSWGQIKNLYR